MEPSVCSTPILDEMGERAGITLPMSTERKKIFPFKTEEEKEPVRFRPMLKPVLPKVAESGY